MARRAVLAGVAALGALLLVPAALPAAAFPGPAALSPAPLSAPFGVADAGAPAARTGGALLAAAAPAAPAAPHDSPGLRVELTSLEPAVIQAGATVSLSGRVTNQLAQTVQGVELELQLHSSSSLTRAGLYQFLSTGEVDGGVDQLVGVLPLAVELAPGTATEFSLSIPAAQLPDWGEDGGPRGLTVAAYALQSAPEPAAALEYRWPTDSGEDGPEGWARTFLVGDSGQRARPVEVGVVAPLAATDAELAAALRHGAPVARVAQQRAADLAQAGALPGITLAVDPMLLQPDLETSQFLRADLSPISALDPSARRASTPFKLASSPTPLPSATPADTGPAPTGPSAAPSAPGLASASAAPAATAAGTEPGAAASAPSAPQSEAAGAAASATPGEAGGAAASTSPTPQPSVAANDKWAALPLAHALRSDDEIMWLTPWDVPGGREYPTEVDWLPQALPGVPTLSKVAWADSASWDSLSLYSPVEGGQFSAVIAPVAPTLQADDAPPATELQLAGARGTYQVAGVQPDRPLSLAAAGKDLQGKALTALERRQLLISQTALLAGAASGEPVFLAAIERGNAVSAADLAAVSAALEASPWATPVPLSRVLGVPAEQAAAADAEGASPQESASRQESALPHESALPQEGSGAGDAAGNAQANSAGPAAQVELAPPDSAHVARLMQVRTGVESLDALLQRSNAQSAYWAVEGAAAQLSSSAWAHPTDPAAAGVFADFHQRLDTVNQAVGINSPSTINLIDSSAQVPLSMHNPLPVPVRVGLLLTPHSAHLRFEEVTVSLEPKRHQVVHVPVKAVGNADVDVLAELYGYDGTVVGSPIMLQVRVRADWEKLGFGTVSAIGLLLFALALVRNYVKRRHTGPGEENAPGEPANGWIPPRTTTRPPQPEWAKLLDTDERQDG